MHGRLVALSGNIQALRAKRRYLDCDLNRVWADEELERLRRSHPVEDTAERREQRELLAALDGYFAEGWEHIILLDLHSISAHGAPFAITGDTLQNRAVAFQLSLPVVLGLEERIEGTLLSYVGELGHVAICIEGGQNDVESTVDHHAAAVWLTLVASGLLAEHDVPELAARRELLRRTVKGLPLAAEIRYRKPIPTAESFEMLPGFLNFARVAAGEVVARVGVPGRWRDVRAPTGGLLLMPRYQGQGDDGFFIGREVRPLWLRVSALVRRARLAWILPLLPGIRRDPARPRVLLANPRVARWFVLEILHLFGYRRSARAAAPLVFIRRPGV